MKTISKLAYLLLASLLWMSCDPDEPEPEEDGEVITNVILTFTPQGETTASKVTAEAEDADGAGAGSLEVLDTISLVANTQYILTIELENRLEDPTESVTEEIEEEADSHQFFFSFGSEQFTNTTGTGNIDSDGTVDYLDYDSDSLAVGLETSWTTANANFSDGSFRVRLQHLEDLKSATVTSSDGDTDIDITFFYTTSGATISATKFTAVDKF